MKSKNFLALIVILCALSAITYYILHQQQPTSSSERMGEPLFKDLPLGDISAITIDSKNQDSLETITFKRENDQWIVKNYFDYPANFTSLSDLVGKLVASKIGRSFSASKDSLSRLMLFPPDKEKVPIDQTATRITFFDNGGNQLAGVLIGKKRETSTGEPGGHYLMLDEKDTIFLVDQSLNHLDPKPSKWIENKLFDIKPEAIKSIMCVDTDQQSVKYTLARPEKGKAPEYVDPPEDQTIKTRTINSLFDTLFAFRIENVGGFADDIPDEKTGFDTADQLKFQLFNGTFYTLFPGNAVENDPEKHYLKVQVGFEAPESSEDNSAENKSSIKEQLNETQEAEKSGNSEIVSQPKPDANTISDKPESGEADPGQVAKAALKQNQTLSKWIYVISGYQYKSLVTDPSHFFEKKDNK